MNFLSIKQDNGVITLKEITDLINVQHSKAMLKVEQLAKEPAFGEVSKFDTFNLNNVKISTYLLNKKQAIAVGARLNNALLMKVIDRLEELENQNKPKTTLDLIIQSAQQMQLIQDTQQIQAAQIEKIESNFRIENWQQKRLEEIKNQKVYEIAEKHDLKNDAVMIKKLHSRVWKCLKNRFNIPRYNELPMCEFDNGVSYIKKLTLADLI